MKSIEGNKQNARQNEGLKEKTNRLLIKTPEGISFSMLLASPITRLLAWVIDFFCIAASSVIISNLLAVSGIISLDLSGAINLISYFIISIGYGIFAEWYWRGQTIGKRLLHLRVVDVQGLRLQFSQILIRNLMRIVDSLPGFYMVGGLTCLASRHAQRLGDFAGNTVVVRNPRIPDQDLNQLLAGKYNTLRKYPLLGARLRQRVTPHEAGIALRALLRRDELEPQARIRLFEEVAAHFRCITDFPEESTHGITDEQFVRNIVDILYRNTGQ